MKPTRLCKVCNIRPDDTNWFTKYGIVATKPRFGVSHECPKKCVQDDCSCEFDDCQTHGPLQDRPKFCEPCNRIHRPSEFCSYLKTPTLTPDTQILAVESSGEESETQPMPVNHSLKRRRTQLIVHSDSSDSSTESEQESEEDEPAKKKPSVSDGQSASQKPKDDKRRRSCPKCHRLSSHPLYYVNAKGKTVQHSKVCQKGCAMGSECLKKGCPNAVNNLKELRQASQEQAAKEKRQQGLKSIDPAFTTSVIEAQRQRFANEEQARSSQLQEQQRMQTAALRVHRQLLSTASPESASETPDTQLRLPVPTSSSCLSTPTPQRQTTVSPASTPPFLAPSQLWRPTGTFSSPFSGSSPFNGQMPFVQGPIPFIQGPFSPNFAAFRPGARRATSSVQPELLQAIIQQNEMTQRLLWSIMAMMFPQ